jgi:hypothetical protein
MHLLNLPRAPESLFPHVPRILRLGEESFGVAFGSAAVGSGHPQNSEAARPAIHNHYKETIVKFGLKPVNFWGVCARGSLKFSLQRKLLRKVSLGVGF